METNIKDCYLKYASDIYQIDYELLAYITNKQSNNDSDLIKKRANEIYNKFYKYIKIFSKNVNFNVPMHLNLLCTLIPEFKFEEKAIIGFYNGLTVKMYFDEDIIIKIDYPGIRRFIRFKVDGEVSQMYIKTDNNSHNSKLKITYQCLERECRYLDAEDFYTYNGSELIFFNRTKYECGENGNVIDDYSIDSTYLTPETLIDEQGNKTTVNYYKVLFNNENTVNGECVKRPTYAIVIEKIPEDEDRDIFDLDYFEITEEEYRKLLNTNDYMARRNEYLKIINELLIKHSKSTINIEKM